MEHRGLEVFAFEGRAAHAGNGYWQGRSALVAAAAPLFVLGLGRLGVAL